MTETEKIFLCALYALYLYESVFWIAAGECVWVRRRAGWAAREIGPKSFTLLKRMPVPGDLFLLRPGAVRTATGEPASDETRARARLARLLNRMYGLTMLCRMQLAVLLIYVPVLLATHKLVRLWPIALGLVVTLHVGIVVLVARTVWRSPKRATILGAILLNPMGAVRVMDPIAQALWDGRRR